MAEPIDYDALHSSDEYAEYISEHACGDRVICNGHTLLLAMEQCYLWEDFLDSIGVPLEE